MQYKVLALDLDGTLTNTEKVITPRTKAAFQEAARRGAHGPRQEWLRQAPADRRPEIFPAAP